MDTPVFSYFNVKNTKPNVMIKIYLLLILDFFRVYFAWYQPVLFIQRNPYYFIDNEIPTFLVRSTEQQEAILNACFDFVHT